MVVGLIAGSIDFLRSHCGAVQAETHENRQRMTRTLFALLLSLATTAHAQPPSSPKPFEVTEASSRPSATAAPPAAPSWSSTSPGSRPSPAERDRHTQP